MNRAQNILLLSAVLIIGASISMFNHWEIGGETWGYWFFSRVLSEGGGFVLFDRSPLYTIYLNAFRWIGYPTSVSIEYVVTTFITLFSIVLLFRRFIGLWTAVFASLLWLIFLQDSEPPVQKLALACSNIALFIRLNNHSRFSIALSYAFLSCAYMFRTTYIILLVLFVLWEINLTLKLGDWKALLKKLRPQISDWPLFIVILLFVVFQVWQSPHPWNNVFFSTTTWFPYDNPNSFAGIYSNLDFIEIVKNILRLYRTSGEMIFLPTLQKIYLLLIVQFVFTTLLLIIAFRAFISTEEWVIKVFIIGNVLMICATILVLPRIRYMFPLIPVLIFCAYWFSSILNNFLLTTNKEKIFRISIKIGITGFFLFTLVFIYRLLPQSIMIRPIVPYTYFMSFIYYIIIFLIVIFGISSKLLLKENTQVFLINSIKRISILFFLVFFSRGLLDWVGLSYNITKDINTSDIKIMESRPFSMKASFKSLNSLVQGRNGCMAFESTFVGAFLNIPLEKIYDLQEIPTFGHLEDSVYNGLNPNRIDCLLISKNLSTHSEFKSKYANYINPYADILVSLGAKEYKIPNYGSAIILKPGNQTVGFKD